MMPNPITWLARRQGVLVDHPEDEVVIDTDTLDQAVSGVQLVGYETGSEHRKEGHKAGCPRGHTELALVTPLGTTYIIYTFPGPMGKARNRMAHMVKQVQMNGLSQVVMAIGGHRGHERFPWVLQQTQREFYLYNTGFAIGDTVKVATTPEPGCACQVEHYEGLIGELAQVTDIDVGEQPVHIHPLDWDIPCAWVRPSDVVLQEGSEDPVRQPGATFVYDWAAKRWKLLFSQQEMDKKKGEHIVE